MKNITLAISGMTISMLLIMVPSVTLAGWSDVLKKAVEEGTKKTIGSIQPNQDKQEKDKNNDDTKTEINVDTDVNKSKNISEAKTINDKYNEVKFQKIINAAYMDELKNKKLSFNAIYKGTTTTPGKWKRVQDYINLYLCDIENPNICETTIVIDKYKAESVFDIKYDTNVRVYGSLMDVLPVVYPIFNVDQINDINDISQVGKSTN